jgi:ABC-2 type transport system permease protein
MHNTWLSNTRLSNTWLIARREYLERIRTRGFLVTTIMIPLVMAGFIFGSAIVGSRSHADAHIAVVSSNVQLALDLQTQMQRQRREPTALADPNPQKRNHIFIDPMSPPASEEQATRTLLAEQLDSGDLDGFLWITPAADPSDPPTLAFTPRSSEQSYLQEILAANLTQMLHQPVGVQTVLPPKYVDPDSSAVSITVLFFLMYMVIMLYGMNVARSIIEEKTSRVFEVMLATIRPEEMMAGKILGVGSVGLTQVGIWLTAVLLFGTAFAARLGAASIHIGLTPSQIVFFFVYFLLGYLFYSSIAAALGAMTNSEQELQQLNMLLVLPLAVCFIALRSVLSSPDSTLAQTLALIPPFTPLLMYLRVSLGHPAPWEVALSLVLTSASIYGIIWLTSRIYRIGVLMYGKRPNLPEILRWLKYS